MHTTSKQLQSVLAESALTPISNDETYANESSSLAGLGTHPAGSKKWPQSQRQKLPQASPAISRDPSQWTGEATVTVLGDSYAGQNPTARVPCDHSLQFGKSWRPSMSEETVACGVAGGRGHSRSGSDGDDLSGSMCSVQGKQGKHPPKRQRIRCRQDEVGGEAADEVDSPFMPGSTAQRLPLQQPASLSTYDSVLSAVPGCTSSPLRSHCAALQRLPTSTAGRLPPRSPTRSPSTRKPLSSLGPGSPRLSPVFNSAPHPWTPLPSTAPTVLPEIVPLTIPPQLSAHTSELCSQHLPRQQAQQAQYCQSQLAQEYSAAAVALPSLRGIHPSPPLLYKSPVLPLCLHESPSPAVLPLLTPITASQSSLEGSQGSGWDAGVDTDWFAQEVAAVEDRWASGAQAPHWTPFPRGSRGANTGGFYAPEALPHDMDVEE